MNTRHPTCFLLAQGLQNTTKAGHSLSTGPTPPREAAAFLPRTAKASAARAAPRSPTSTGSLPTAAGCGATLPHSTPPCLEPRCPPPHPPHPRTAGAAAGGNWIPRKQRDGGGGWCRRSPRSHARAARVAQDAAGSTAGPAARLPPPSPRSPQESNSRGERPGRGGRKFSQSRVRGGASGVLVEQGTAGRRAGRAWKQHYAGSPTPRHAPTTPPRHCALGAALRGRARAAYPLRWQLDSWPLIPPLPRSLSPFGAKRERAGKGAGGAEDVTPPPCGGAAGGEARRGELGAVTPAAQGCERPCEGLVVSRGLMPLQRPIPDLCWRLEGTSIPVFCDPSAPRYLKWVPLVRVLAVSSLPTDAASDFMLWHKHGGFCPAHALEVNAIN